MTSMRDLESRAKAILAANDRGGYTVPTPRLYPFQWNWDSAFVAMGFATYDVPRAYRELEMLASAQWDDGMIPQIIFHTESDTYFPGPDVWKTDHKTLGRTRTSGITQPPVFGTALRAVHDAASYTGDALLQSRSLPLFQVALRYHRWWLAARDPLQTGLVAILHNWETGSDNSPAWDAAFEHVPTTSTTEIKRKDTGHIDAAMRPRDIDYQRYIHLVDRYAATGWDAPQQWDVAPFKIAEVQMTAILARATEDLIALSFSLGTPAEQGELLDMHRLLVSGLKAQWRPELGRFVSRDLIAQRDISTPTQAGFMPILALDLDDYQRQRVRTEVVRWIDASGGVLPSVPPFANAFDAKRYWRGPVWGVINWLMVDGLERNGMHDLADRVSRAMVGLIAQQGFAEYFDPLTGEGCGGDAFSWTAAVYLHLKARA
jgi:hypothetical protein